MTYRTKFLFFLIAFLVLGTGCSLAAVPAGRALPTVVPSAVRVLTLDDLRTQAALPVSLSGNSAVGLALDPEIVSMFNEISRQNLMAYVRQLESFGTRNTFSPVDQPGFGIGAAREWIFTEMTRVGGGRLQVSYQDYPLTFEGLSNTQRNVIGVLPGVGGHRGVMVMVANYDTRAEDWLDGQTLSPGADDNASGVAALLEVARVMSAYQWPQTIMFVATTAEEQGTYGARNFVQTALSNGMRIDAAINNDMVGGRAGIPQSARLYSAGPNDSPARQLGRYIHLIGSIYLPEFPVFLVDALDREGRWGDHREFVRAGVAGVRLIESEEDLDIQNSPLDTWTLVDYDYLRRMAQLNLVALANMAAAPGQPESPAVSPGDAPGSYRVVWDIDPTAAGYAVVFRPLNDMTYENAVFQYVSGAESGNLVVAELNPAMTYAVSLAALDGRGRISVFSPEIITGPR